MPFAAGLVGLKATALSLLTIPANYPKNIAEFASKWADAYALYAMQGAGVLALAPLDPTGTSKTLFEAQLLTIPSVSIASNAAQVALAFQNAVMAFWAPMLFTTVGFVTTLGTPIVATIEPALKVIFLVLSPSGAQKANDIADVLNAATITTSATHPVMGVDMII